MKIKHLLYFLLFLSFSASAQQSQVKIAQNSIGKLQASIANKEEIKKQLGIIGEGIKAVELAQADKKTKNWPETWAVKAYLSSYIAIVDGDGNADKHYLLASEALEKAIDLDKFQANQYLIDAAQHNLIIKKQTEGNNAYQQNDFSAAYKLLKEVSDYFPKDTTLAVNVGICAQNTQDYTEALSFYKRAKEHGIKNPAVYQHMASIYASKFESELAIKTLEDGLALNPYHPFLTNDYLNLLLDNERYEKALKVIDQSLTSDKTSKLLIYLYGYLQQTQQKNIGTAEIAYQKVLGIDQNYFDALYQLGLVYLDNANLSLKEKDTQKFTSFINRAELALLHAHEINLNDRNTIQLLIEIYTRKNRLDKVQDLKRKVNEF